MGSALASPFFRSLKLAAEHSRGEISDSAYCIQLVAAFAASQGKRLSEAELAEMEPGEITALAVEVVGRFDLAEELADG